MRAAFASMGESRRRSCLGLGSGLRSGLPSRRWLTVLAAAFVFAGSTLASMASDGTQIPSGKYRIAGMVVSAKGGNPLARCRVTITDLKNQQSTKFVITGDDGRFEFHVPDGKFSLEGAKRGFITASYNQHDQFSSAIVTAADVDTENLVLRLASNAVLTGQVLDESGEPVRNAQVMVYREDHSLGVSHTSLYRGVATDDQGRYEVTPLDEGTYFVSAKATPWYAVHPVTNGADAMNNPPQVDSSLDVAYPITYYGDSADADDATPIPVRGGDRLEADIHLSPVPAVHLIVHVPQGGNFPTLYKPVFDDTEQLEGHSVESVAPGTYELSGFAAGRYTVRMPSANGNMSEPSEVSLGTGGELDVSATKSTSQIKATVPIGGGTSFPADLQLLLRPNKGKTIHVQVDGKGEANFVDIIAGKYDVLAGSATERFSVTRISSEAGTTTGHTLTVPAGASLSITLTLVGGSTAVEGYAERNRKPVAGVMVVLVPKDADADYDRLRRDESDTDGGFSLHDVIPGSYTLVAIENGWDLDWAEPAVLAQYVKRGQAIEIGNKPTTMHLPDPVEVQAK